MRLFEGVKRRKNQLNVLPLIEDYVFGSAFLITLKAWDPSDAKTILSPHFYIEESKPAFYVWIDRQWALRKHIKWYPP